MVTMRAHSLHAILLYFTLFQSILLSTKGLLQIDCLSNDLFLQACNDYITLYLQSYAGNRQNLDSTYFVPDQGYSIASLPQDTTFIMTDSQNQIKTVTTLQVGMNMQVFRMSDIDELNGFMNLESLVTLTWKDDRLAWNKSLTNAMNLPYVFLTPGLDIWFPDITLLNTVDNVVLGDLPGTNAQVYPDGKVLWLFSVALRADCDINLTYFPFDTQQCPFAFASVSNAYVYGFNLSFIPFFSDKSPKTSYFTSSVSWETKDITHIRRIMNLFTDSIQTVNDDDDSYEVNIDFLSKTIVLVWYVTAKRYYCYYLASGIVPNLLIVLLSLFSLWLYDYPARLGLTVTAMLSVVAILWTTTARLPSSEGFTWMEVFSIVCLGFVTFINIETCLVFYLSRKDTHAGHDNYNPQNHTAYIGIQSNDIDEEQQEDNNNNIHLHNNNNHHHHTPYSSLPHQVVPKYLNSFVYIISGHQPSLYTDIITYCREKYKLYPFCCCFRNSIVDRGSHSKIHICDSSNSEHINVNHSNNNDSINNDSAIKTRINQNSKILRTDLPIPINNNDNSNSNNNNANNKNKIKINNRQFQNLQISNSKSFSPRQLSSLLITHSSQSIENSITTDNNDNQQSYGNDDNINNCHRSSMSSGGEDSKINDDTNHRDSPAIIICSSEMNTYNEDFQRSNLSHNQQQQQQQQPPELLILNTNPNNNSNHNKQPSLSLSSPVNTCSGGGPDTLLLSNNIDKKHINIISNTTNSHNQVHNNNVATSGESDWIEGDKKQGKSRQKCIQSKRQPVTTTTTTTRVTWLTVAHSVDLLFQFLLPIAYIVFVIYCFMIVALY